jgi:hypothetical protein
MNFFAARTVTASRKEGKTPFTVTLQVKQLLLFTVDYISFVERKVNTGVEKSMQVVT